MNNREVMQQALEALESTSPTGFNMESDKKFFAAISALRAALAEPEPVAHRHALPPVWRLGGKEMSYLRAASQQALEALENERYVSQYTQDQRSYHDAIVRMAASLVAGGMFPGAAVAHLYSLMDAVRPSGPPEEVARWSARRAEIPRAVRLMGVDG